jgi:hypothetical protein
VLDRNERPRVCSAPPRDGYQTGGSSPRRDLEGVVEALIIKAREQENLTPRTSAAYYSTCPWGSTRLRG